MITSTLYVNGTAEASVAFQSNISSIAFTGSGSLQTVNLGQYGAAAPRGTSVRVGDVAGAAYYMNTGSWDLSFYKDNSSGGANLVMAFKGVSGTNVTPTTYFPNSVGIGTTNPNATLDVNGQVNRTVPFLYRYQNAATTIPNETNTILQYQVLDGTSQGTTGLTYNAGVFTNTSGRTIVVSVTFTVFWLTASSTGARVIYITLTNGASTRRPCVQGVQANASDYTYLNGSAVFALANNDYFTTNAWQNSGIPLNTSAESSTSIQIAVL